ncbi:MAG: PfkB family carbohydrate kinase [Pseudomonadota bacterium]
MTVLVAGSYNFDQLFHTDQLPGPGETRLGEFSSAHGGKGFNQAVAAHRAGAEVRFVGAIGDDAAGAGAQAFAREEGLAAAWAQVSETPTGVAAVLTDASGENQIVVAPGANLALTAEMIATPIAALGTGDVFLTQLESPVETVNAGLAAARARGALTILNPAPAPANDAASLLAHADIITPNETEFAALYQQLSSTTLPTDWTEAADDQLFHWFRELEVPGLALTLGAQGGYWAAGPALSHLAAEGGQRFTSPRVEAVDSTGAGDAFNGNLAAALSQGHGLGPSITRAATAAALAVTVAGATPAMPRASEVDRLLAPRVS